MTNMTVQELIDQLNKVEDKTKIVKVFETEFIGGKKLENTIREVSYTNNKVVNSKLVIIFTFA